jgi:hypothetical protein
MLLDQHRREHPSNGARHRRPSQIDLLGGRSDGGTPRRFESVPVAIGPPPEPPSPLAQELADLRKRLHMIWSCWRHLRKAIQRRANITTRRIDSGERSHPCGPHRTLRSGRLQHITGLLPEVIASQDNHGRVGGFVPAPGGFGPANPGGPLPRPHGSDGIAGAIETVGQGFKDEQFIRACGGPFGKRRYPVRRRTWHDVTADNTDDARRIKARQCLG